MALTHKGAALYQTVRSICFTTVRKEIFVPRQILEQRRHLDGHGEKEGREEGICIEMVSLLRLSLSPSWSQKAPSPQWQQHTGWPISWRTGFSWLRFGMFRHPAWAVGRYISGQPAGGTPHIARRWATLYYQRPMNCWVWRQHDKSLMFYTTKWNDSLHKRWNLSKVRR